MPGESPIRRHAAWGLACLAVLVVSPYLRTAQRPERKRARLGDARDGPVPRPEHRPAPARMGLRQRHRQERAPRLFRQGAGRELPRRSGVVGAHEAAQPGRLAGAGQARDDVLAAAVRGEAAAVSVPAVLRALCRAHDRVGVRARSAGGGAGAGDAAVSVRRHVRRSRAGRGDRVHGVHVARRRARRALVVTAGGRGSVRGADRDVRVPGGAGSRWRWRSTRRVRYRGKRRRWRRSSRGRCRRRWRWGLYHTALFGRPWRFPFGTSRTRSTRARRTARASTVCRCRTPRRSARSCFRPRMACSRFRRCCCWASRAWSCCSCAGVRSPGERRDGALVTAACVLMFVFLAGMRMARWLVRGAALHRVGGAVPDLADHQAVAALRGRSGGRRRSSSGSPSRRWC